MLSNTAVPRYYGEFRDAVLAGEFPVCETISMEMNRIDALIDDPDVYYDDSKVEGWIAFCESELTLTDGSDMHLLDSFKLWGEQVYGWYEFVPRKVYRPNKNGPGGHYITKVVKKRLINKQFLIVSRGAAKTVYGATHQGYGLTVDVTTTKQIATAHTMKQGEEMLNPLRTAITRARGPLFQFLTEGSIQNTTGSKMNRVKLTPTKKGIENFLTNSLLEVRPMTIDKLQGLQVKYSTVDEWLSCDIREDPIGALEQGGSKVDDYLIISMSSEGTVRNGVGDSIKMELMKILKGEYVNRHVSIFWYKLDDVKEVANPEMWIKANPNIGITVKYESIQLDVERAENAPAAANDILAKRFGIPREGYTYFFTYEETRRCKRKQNYDGMPCSLGWDLSKGDDFCAFTFLFPLKQDLFGIKVLAYITERTFEALPAAMQEKYKEFISEETLVVMPGITLNMDDVYDDLSDFIVAHDYEIICVGYDPYNADVMLKRWEQEYSLYGVIKVIQGAKTETVPLGELKKISEVGGLLFDESLMSFSMGNAIVLQDTNGNKKLYKLRRDLKIDNVSALMDAYVSWKANIDMF